MMGSKVRKTIVTLAIGICLFVVPVMAWAKEGDRDQGDYKIMINAVYDEEILENTSFYLHYLSEENADGVYHLPQRYPHDLIDLNHTDTSEMHHIADTLTGYVIRDQIQADQKGHTDDSGKLLFDDLDSGLYLLYADTLKKDDTSYQCQTMLVHVSEKSENMNDNMVLEVMPKFNKDIETDGVMDKSVVKVWDDEGFKQLRPKSVEIQLICNDKIYDTITLSEENNWRHTWNNLSKKDEWHITEVVPEKYKVTIDDEKQVVNVINSYVGKNEKENIKDKSIPRTGISYDAVRRWMILAITFAFMACIWKRDK